MPESASGNVCTFASQLRKSVIAELLTYIIYIIMKNRKMKFLSLYVGEACAREVWRSICLLENKYKCFMYEMIARYIRTGRVEQIDSAVLRGMYERLVVMIKGCVRQCGA